MKQIIMIILLLISNWAHAREIVTLVYPWALGDSMAGIMMSMLDQANKSQNQYRFVIESRPGAGGAIAANHVLRSPNTILATSAAVWLRPRFYPQDSHDPGSLKTLLVQFECPFAVASNRFQNWSDLNPATAMTIGTSGLGVVTHLTALQIQKRYPTMVVVPFKSTTESLQNAVGRHVDFHVGFVRQAEQYAETHAAAGITILGVTGTQAVKKWPTLLSQGFDKNLSQISLTHFLMVPNTIPHSQFLIWQNILKRAMQHSSVKNLYQQDYCTGQTHVKDLDQWQTDQINFWQNITRGVVINDR